jgi:predicted Zn-dependent peptidase
MLSRTVAPPITDAVDFKLSLRPYEKYILKNGAEVYAVNAGAEEVMMLEWVYFAGNCYEDKNLTGASANFLLRNGTSSKTAFQLNEHFEYYGSYVNRACHHETASISLHTLTKHVQELLPVVREMIMDSVMPEEELNIYKQNQKQRLKVSLKKSDFVAGRLIDVYLFGEKHPYGKYSSAEEYDALNREELMAFYDKYYRNGRFIIFAAGKLPSNLEQLLNEQFGDLQLNNIPAPADIPAPAVEKKYRITNDKNGVQGSIRIARPFPNRHHPDFLKAQVLNILLGGFFGSRLMSNIREDKGYTYGIHSFVQNHIQHSAWMISTEAGKDVCEATIAEVYKEMNLLKEEKVDAEELKLVQNYMMGSILGDLDGPFQIIARWKNYILNGLDETYFYRAIDTIKSISSKELQQLAQKYFDTEEFYELVVI